MFGLTHNVDSAIAGLLRLSSSQVPFATAMALNDTAASVGSAVEADIGTSLNKPTTFTQRAVYKTRASKTDQQATVGIKRVQAGYLIWQIEGGQRLPNNRAVVVPVGLVTTANGNMPRRALGKLLARPDVFIASSGDPRTSHLAPGIYRRGAVGKRRDGERGTKGSNSQGKDKKRSTVKLMVAFENSVTYEDKPFDFYGVAGKAAQASYRNHFERRLEAAIRTAK